MTGFRPKRSTDPFGEKLGYALAGIAEGIRAVEPTSWGLIFTDAARKDLLDLGVTARQIDELAFLLPLAQGKLINEAGKPSNTDVVGALSKARKAVASARRALLSVSASANGHPMTHARLSVVLAPNGVFATDRDWLLSELPQQLELAERTLKRAESGWPMNPVRRRTAQTYPIHLIHTALLPNSMFSLVAANQVPKKFREVVKICYVEMGQDCEPDRAIRAYLAELKKGQNGV